ncbi:hypothetical protein SAMN04487950_0522 [Halogranum rubrum]|uniref:Uncharacterized protein n=1 Tax=Halogranum rubrum TaxID=553466 RepID=A0A1I4BF68_9EURY|nr:hypothetical protein [Halogranum rubrum]SFK67464.1 hypothetical protein SAMN04487950_0522 [Halogranum rubrum]
MSDPSDSKTQRGRVWASKWYRIRPQTFEHYELFFERDRIYAAYAEESFKSVLLRRDGREREATQVGDTLRDAPPETLLANDRSFVIDTAEVTRLELRSGTFLFKPKLTIETESKTYEFYHPERSHDTTALADQLETQFGNTVPIKKTTAPLSW